MNSKNWTLIGKITKAHSLKGELFLFVFSHSFDWYSKNMTLHLSPDDSGKNGVEKIITFLKPHKEGARILLDSVSDRTEAEKWVKSFVFISNDKLVSSPGESLFLKEILNFFVFDNKIKIGTVVGFYSNGDQDILEVQSPYDEIYDIPLVDPFIKSIDHSKKEIYLELPQGLLEINSSKKE